MSHPSEHMASMEDRPKKLRKDKVINIISVLLVEYFTAHVYSDIIIHISCIEYY